MIEFLTQPEPVIVLVGLPTYPEPGDTDTPCVVILGQESQYKVPNSTRGFLEFLCEPRRESEVREWLTHEGAPDDALDQLVNAGKVIVIRSGGPMDVATALSGFRLFSNCELLDWPDGEVRVETIVMVGNKQFPDMALPVPTYLASSMWHVEPGEDFPATLTRIASHTDHTVPALVEEVLNWLPGLLASGYGFFGPVEDQPSTKRRWSERR